MPDGVSNRFRASSTRFNRPPSAYESTSNASKSLIVRPCASWSSALSNLVVRAYARSSLVHARTAGSIACSVKVCVIKE